jgi:hypothetical protein
MQENLLFGRGTKAGFDLTEQKQKLIDYAKLVEQHNKEEKEIGKEKGKEKEKERKEKKRKKDKTRSSSSESSSSSSSASNQENKKKINTSNAVPRRHELLELGSE